jgi:hypothetical protein
MREVLICDRLDCKLKWDSLLVLHVEFKVGETSFRKKEEERRSY